MTECENKKAIDYRVFFNCSIFEFYKILCNWPGTNEHHVIHKSMRNGEIGKELKETFGINPKETKDVLAPAHAINNRLFKNSPPPATLQKLAELIESSHINWLTRQDFVKFSLCVLKEKFETIGKQDKFFKIKGIVQSIEFDINNGSNITTKVIMNLLGLNESNIAYYLEKNFFPQNWRYLDEHLWDLYQ